MLRASLLACVIAACGGGPAYHLAVTDAYEVGEDPTITLHVREASEQPGVLVITRPDGTEVRRRVALDTDVARIRFGRLRPSPRGEPTFTAPGVYRVELRVDDAVLAREQVTIEVDRLGELLPAEEVAGYKPVARYTRPKQHAEARWMTYSVFYEHPWRSDEVPIEISIETPGEHLEVAWQPYVEEGTRAVIESSDVLFRERTDNVTASWISDGRIVVMRAATLADLGRGLIGHFLARFPSELTDR